MPDGKPDIDEDLDDDPFEGLELGADAPEPTQEEMDEWATLDTPDEDASPTFAAGSRSEPAAPAPPATEPVAPPAPAPVPVQTRRDEEVVEEHESEEEDSEELKISAAAPPTPAIAPVAAEPEGEAKGLPSAAEPADPTRSPTVPSAPVVEVPEASPIELPEITPSFSPAPAPRPAPEGDDRNYFQNEDNEQSGEDGEEEEQRQQQRQQQGGAGWGVGWGAGWGLGALGGKLRQVAAGAVRDVKDLTETFQAALADVTGAEDEVEEARRISAMDRADEAGANSTIVDVAQASGSSSLPTDAPRQAAEPAREAAFAAGSSVARSGASSVRGSSGGAPEPPAGPADPTLEVGLQAIDAQVEQLATGAARAFSSLWGGLSSVAKVVAAEVAASVADVQSSEAVRGVAQIGTKLAHTAERGLETVGRTAMTLLEEVAGVGANNPGRRRIWGEEADARAADMGHEPTTFQDFFYIYGGEQLAEEVNNLSNECSHLCNKSRSKLEADQQQALDEALARLGPYFSDPWVGRDDAPAAADAAATAESDAAPTQEAATPLALLELDERSKEAAERLGQMYDPINYLCQDSLTRAEVYLHQLREAMAAAKRQQTLSPEKSGSKQRKAEAADAEDSDEERGAEEEEALLPEAAQVDPRALLDSFRAHFTKRMAEVTTAQLQLLLNLGASLAAPARTGRPAADGISWPDSSEQQAVLLATESRRMVADLRAIAKAYLATIASLRAEGQIIGEAEGEAAAAEGAQADAELAAEAVNAPASTEASSETAVLDRVVLGEMVLALWLNADAASSSVKNGCKGLLYAVLLRSLVTQIAQQEDSGAEEVAQATSAAQ